MNGSTKEISVKTQPSGATAIVDGGATKTTPCEFKLTRDVSHQIQIEKSGYKTVRIDIESKESGAILGSILLGGLIGVAIDAGTGASKTLYPDDIDLALTPGSGEMTWSAPPRQKKPNRHNSAER